MCVKHGNMVHCYLKNEGSDLIIRQAGHVLTLVTSDDFDFFY